MRRQTVRCETGGSSNVSCLKSPISRFTSIVSSLKSNSLTVYYNDFFFTKGAPMTQRIEWIDALKGFAILIVVIGHCAADSLASHTYVDYAKWIQMIADAIYSFHMPFFFMVSGYVFYLTKSYRKWKEKVRDFTIVYVIWCTLMWLSKYLMNGDVNHPVTIIDLFSIVYKPIMVYWYLYVLILFYAIFSYFKWEKISWGFLAALAGVATATKTINPDIGITNQMLYHMFYFTAGG